MSSANQITALDIDHLISLIDQGDKHQLRLILNEQYPQDIAELLPELDENQQLFCFRLLDLDHASETLAELDPEIQKRLLGHLGNIGIVPIVSKMSPDDAADLLSELPDETAESIISQMTDNEAAGDLYELMSFKDDSAGGIMSTDFLSLPTNMTVEQVLAKIKDEYEEVEEELYDIFVIDEEEHLVGHISVKDLLTAPLEAQLSSIMDTNVIKVSTDTDQEEAAEKLKHYDLLSLPVVDNEGKLRGVITADDAIDVLAEEATEDIYQSSGIDVTDTEASESLKSSVRQAVRARLPWLVITLLIESVAAMVITQFDHVIKQTIIAASFMPLLTSVTGSVAMQSTCIVIRGSRKQFNFRTAVKNIFHEIRVGMLLGTVCGTITALVCLAVLHDHNNLGLVVGVSLFLTMSIGVLIGTLIPIIFDRLGFEPAHASGPLITSLLDVCTMTIYLYIVHAFLLHII
jgi:magnesium transporter